MASKGRGYRVAQLDGWEIWIGKGAAENDVLTFREADSRDFWLHVAGYAGSHVIVRNPQEVAELPREVLQRAAELAAWHSKAREARGKVEVHACRVADVRKPRGFAAGKVQLRNWESLKVYPKDQVGTAPAHPSEVG